MQAVNGNYMYRLKPQGGRSQMDSSFIPAARKITSTYVKPFSQPCYMTVRPVALKELARDRCQRAWPRTCSPNA
eukprot:2769012-Pyramimonas_sp.AAC.1